MMTNLIGTVYWMSSGMLEGSLRALEHAKERQESQVEMVRKVHQEEMTKLQNEMQDVLEAAETFEKEAQLSQEMRQKAERELQALQNEKLSWEEQLKSAQEENQKLLDTLVRHTKDRANNSISATNLQSYPESITQQHNGSQQEFSSAVSLNI